MALTVTFEPEQSRMALQVTGLSPKTSAAFWCRHPTTQGDDAYQIIRGGASVPLTSGASAVIYDYEFPILAGDGYRAYYAATGPTDFTYVNVDISAAARQCWLKLPGFPFLNQELTVVDFGEVSRSRRGSTLTIPGTSRSIALQDYMTGRSFELTTRTETWAEFKALDEALALGAVVFLHADEARLGLPSTYGVVASSSSDRAGRKLYSQVRYTKLAIEECAKPHDQYVYTGDPVDVIVP